MPVLARFVAVVAVLLLGTATVATATPDAGAHRVEISEYRLSQAAMDTLRSRWTDQILARHAPGTWAPLRYDLDDRALALMGLPPAAELGSQRYPVPTLVSADGPEEDVALPTVATFAGTGYFGIRPGAFFLVIEGDSIGWCTMAHVTGIAGDYNITTAGHCGAVGATATVIAGFGNHNGVLKPILLDFGTFVTSRNGGLGNDYAVIDIPARYQSLVTPTMAFWGGPRGQFTKTGAVAEVSIPDSGIVPSVAVNPDPLLAQPIVHYGHGSGIGAGGTPRAGEAIAWGNSVFMFFGAISPGDSGSGANTLGGDSVGATMEAAGIITHIYVDPLMRKGVGIMGGTRSTYAPGTPVRGQLLSYPVPAPLLP